MHRCALADICIKRIPHGDGSRHDIIVNDEKVIKVECEVEYNMIEHTIKPVFDKNSKILILGSFPSVKSREEGFFYGHPQNRFWKVLSHIFNGSLDKGQNKLVTIDEKRSFLIENNIAVWDVIKLCDIEGSSDSSIKNVVPNDLRIILEEANIEKIIVNGKKAEQLYKKYIQPKINREAICLPSTSPANATWGIDRLVEEWGKVLK